jgi:hypothetical protein
MSGGVVLPKYNEVKEKTAVTDLQLQPMHSIEERLETGRLARHSPRFQ